MKQRAMMLVVLLLAMTMVLSACDGVVSGGLLQKLFFELGNDLNDIPEDVSQIIEVQPEDYPEDLTVTMQEDISVPESAIWPETTEPTTTESDIY